jgi:hypothetical protein
MMLILLWTSTLLHDFAESGNLLTANSFIQRSPDINFVNREEHFHDAALTLKKGSDLTSWTTVLAFFAVQSCWQFNSDHPQVKLPLQRPPPLVSLGLPTQTFMEKRSLLI